MRRCTIAEKITAQKKLAATFGVDEKTWANMTQKQLDEFWDANCRGYTLVYVRGEGLKYIPMAEINPITEVIQ
jgi:hypothetical protein